MNSRTNIDFVRRRIPVHHSPWKHTRHAFKDHNLAGWMCWIEPDSRSRHHICMQGMETYLHIDRNLASNTSPTADSPTLQAGRRGNSTQTSRDHQHLLSYHRLPTFKACEDTTPRKAQSSTRDPRYLQREASQSWISDKAIHIVVHGFNNTLPVAQGNADQS